MSIVVNRITTKTLIKRKNLKEQIINQVILLRVQVKALQIVTVTLHNHTIQIIKCRIEDMIMIKIIVPTLAKPAHHLLVVKVLKKVVKMIRKERANLPKDID